MCFLDEEPSTSQPPSKKLKLNKDIYWELYQATNYKPEISGEDRKIALEVLKNGIDSYDLETLYGMTRISQRNDIEKTVIQQIKDYPYLKNVSSVLEIITDMCFVRKLMNL